VIVAPDRILEPHLLEFPDGRIMENEDGWVARTWIPLPEPLPLPNGWSRRLVRPVDFSDVDYFRDMSEIVDADVIQGALSVIQVPKTIAPLDYRGLDEALIARARALGHNGDHKAVGPGAEEVPVTVTVLDVTTIGWTDDSQETLSAAFDLSIDWAQQLQREVRTAVQRPIALVTRQLLSPTLPIETFKLKERLSPPSGSSHWMALHFNVNAITEAGSMSDSEWDRFENASRFSNRPGLTTPASDVLLEAHLALTQRGDTRACVLAAATYVEATLDHLLAALLWEQGVAPIKAAEIFNSYGFVKRMRKNFPSLLGGAWDTDSSPIVKEWEDRCHKLRHRVIHRDYYPAHAEATQSLNAAQDFIRLVVNRLASRAKDFPRTAVKWIGRGDLPANRKVSELLDRITGAEPDWDEMFDRWLRTMWSESQFRHREPDLDRSVLIAVVTERPSTGFWVALDPELMLGCVVTLQPDDKRKALTAKAVSGMPHQTPCPFPLLLPGTAETAECAGEWMASYRLAPPDKPLHPSAVWPTVSVPSGPLI